MVMRVLLLFFALHNVYGWIGQVGVGRLRTRAHSQANDSGPSWIQPSIQEEEELEVPRDRSLASSPPWLSAEEAKVWSTKKPKRKRFFSKKGVALRSKIQEASSWRVPRRYVDDVPVEAISRGYLASTAVFFGAAADAAMLKEATVASAFGLAAIVSLRLANAAKNQRLSSPTYSRLTLYFAIFGWIHAVLRYMSPAAFAAYFITSASCFFGASRAKSILHLEPRGLLPKNFLATGFFIYLVLPCALAAFFTAYFVKDIQFTLAATTFSVLGLVLTDAANRKRFKATTFKRLGLGLGIALLISAASGGLFKPVIDSISIKSYTVASTVSIVVTAMAALLPLSSSIKAVLADKRI